MLKDSDKKWLGAEFKLVKQEIASHRDNECGNMKKHKKKCHPHIHWVKTLTLACFIIVATCAALTFILKYRGF